MGRSVIRNRQTLATSPARALALKCLEAGINAGRPSRVFQEQVAQQDGVLAVPDEDYALDAFEEVLVLGGGKAADRQAAALESLLGDRIDRGMVVTDEAAHECERVQVLTAGHPVPTASGVEHAHEMLALAEEADANTLALVVISGGGSALLTVPATGIGLPALQAVTEDLLGSGATIREINAVRKHLSSIKGGLLARTLAPATVPTFLLSDVVGDDPAVIASGPTVPDPTTFADAAEVLARYGIKPQAEIRERLHAGRRGTIDETPKPGDAIFDRVGIHVLAGCATPMQAAAKRASAQGMTPVELSSRIRGEAREAAKTQVAIAEECLARGKPVAAPAVFVSGGETTVTIAGDGVGGPNQEFGLSAALELDTPITVAAVDTDGIDGAAPAAGALVDQTTVEDRSRARAAIADNDAYTYLDERADVITTGPTGTNLNDLRVVVAGSPSNLPSG